MKKNENTFSIVNPRGGISLIVLIITISVMMILVGVTVNKINVSNNDAKEVAFVNDVSAIEDSVMSEYILTGKIPTVDDIEYTKDDLLSLAKDSTTLAEEIRLNNDDEAKFSKISLEKINVKSSSRGTGKDSLDFYAISSPNMNVYYLKGYNIGNKTYFSIVNLSGKIAVDNSLDNSSTSVQTTAGIKFTKTTTDGNKIGAKIEVDMEEGELLYVSFSKDITSNDKRFLRTTIGSNVITFNNLTELKNIYSTDITNTDIAKIEGDLSIRSSNRYLNIGKFKGNEVVGSIKIDLNNYGTIAPKITANNVLRYKNQNTVTLNFKKGDSTIKEVKYVYYKVYNSLGVEMNYYENPSVTDEFIISKGIKASVTNASVTLKVHKYVKSIKALVMDVAGNYNSFDVEVLNSFDGVGMDLGENESGSGSGIESEQSIKDVITEGDYIEYNSKRDYKGTWRVLYDGKDGANGNRIEIISTGNADYLSIGNVYNVVNAESSYANMIRDLNSSANLYLNEKYADRARCVGSDASDPSYKETISTGNMKYMEYIPLQAIYNFIQTHYESDEIKLRKIGEFYKEDSYWLAARNASTISYLSTEFSARFVDTDGLSSASIINYKNPDEIIHGNFGPYSKVCGVRPVISIKKEVIITGGDGTENNPYKLK